MATTTATLNVNATQALQTLTKVQKQVDSLGSAFGKLRNIIGGLAIGSFVTNMLRAADAMDDLSKATGISISTIDGFGAALARSGGEAEDAATLITRFSQTLEEGREGTLKAENSFGKLGISIQELRTLSDEDVLRKTIEGLAKLPPGAQRTALAMELLGKSARTIDWNNLNGSIDAFIGKAKQAEPGTKALAQLFDNLQGIGKAFATQLTVGGTNFAELLVKLTSDVDKIAKSLIALTGIVAIAGASFGVFKYVIPNIQKVKDIIADIGKISSSPQLELNFGKGFSKASTDAGLLATAVSLVKGQFKQAGNELQQFIDNMLRAIGVLDSGYKWWASIGFAVGALSKALLRLTGVIGVLYSVGEAFKFLTGTINPVAKILETIRDIVVVSLAGWKMLIDLVINFAKELYQLSGIPTLLNNIANVVSSAVGPVFESLYQQFQRFGKWWRGEVKAAERALGINKFDARNFGAREATPEESGVRFPAGAEEGMAAAEQATELDKLRAAIERTTTAFINQKNAQLGQLQAQASYVNMSERAKGILDAQRSIYEDFNNKIDEYREKIAELPPEQEKLKGTYLAQISVLQKLRDEQMNQAAAAVNATYDQIDAQQELIRQNELLKNQMESDLQLNQLRDQIELIGLMGDELEDAQIVMQVSQNLERELLALRERELDLIERKGQLTEEQFNKEMAQINALRNAASERANKELDIKREQKDKERELENSYTQGILRGLEDIKEKYKPINVAQEAVRKGWQAIENAVDTFVETGKFKFSDFARSVIVDIGKMIAKMMIFKALEAGLNALSPGLGSLIFGGGKAKGGPVKSDTAYLVGEKGPELFVPQSNGSIVPNNRLGNGAMASQAAGPITNNFNTYNINALDAKSVAQLFAENRKAIFGANKMAEREMSYAGVR